MGIDLDAAPYRVGGRRCSHTSKGDSGMNGRCLAAAGCFLLFVAPAVPAGDWPQFRGPLASATSADPNLPLEWSADKNVAWKFKVPGYAWSSPIVWGDRVFVTTAVTDKQKKPSAGFMMGGFGKGKFGKGDFPKGPDGFGKGKGGFGKGGFPRGGFGKGGFGFGKLPDTVYQWQVYCLSAADGKVLWKQTAVERKPTYPINPANTYASETPVTDGERVFAYFGMTGVVCYDFDGKLVWKRDLKTYPIALGMGGGASPALDGHRLFIQCDNEEKSFLMALDSRTGKDLWQVERAERTGWSTPFIWKNKLRTEVVCLGSSKVRSYDPATGKQLWELGGMNGQSHASPAAGDDLLFVGAPGSPFGGGPKPMVAVKAGAAGDITLKKDETSNAGVAWYLSRGWPGMASPVFYQGHLYVLEQRPALLYCYEAATGKQIYKERLQGASSFTSSPWVYDGKIFCLADDGQTYVVQAGPQFKLLATNKIDEMCWSTPAVAAGALFLRTVDHLYCIKKGDG
jgi:outer membrane protein assembly factor BamB